MIALIDTFNNKVVSTHRTVAAAESAADKLQSSVKRANGSSSYLPTVLVEANGLKKGEILSTEELASAVRVANSWED
jgi:hypothetical protein